MPPRPRKRSGRSGRSGAGRRRRGVPPPSGRRAGVALVTSEGTGVDATKTAEAIRPLWTLGDRPSEPTFSYATWVDFDPAGNVYVLDSLAQKFTRLTSDGRVLQQFGERGEKPGQLSKRRRLARGDG